MTGRSVAIDPVKHPRRYRARSQGPAQQPHGLWLKFAWRTMRRSHQQSRAARCLAPQCPCTRAQAGASHHARAEAHQGACTKTQARDGAWTMSLCGCCCLRANLAEVTCHPTPMRSSVVLFSRSARLRDGGPDAARPPPQKRLGGSMSY